MQNASNKKERNRILYSSDCGQVYSTKPFSSQGEMRRCTLQSDHIGAHSSEIPVPVRPNNSWVNRAIRPERFGKLPSKSFR